MILLGSVQRVELIRMLEEHLGRDRKMRSTNTGAAAADVVNEQLPGNGKKPGSMYTRMF